MKAIYNNIMKRWLYGSDKDLNDLNYKSAVFKEGYDDPTYMTFRIEFGDWGASVLDRSLINTGTSEFKLNFNDYDALPIGLLNCPEPDNMDNTYWQDGVSATSGYQDFNNIKRYSAFQYLRSRNEDQRAKYLYYFVNGLFEIQKDYPFIFKKVSGLSELEKMDPNAGQRLKTPAKITLECYEGLDLKIRTLFEFYRKAAWDDVYQRWILPENMREFKMIIYIFERRIFQDTQMFNTGGNNSTQTNMLMSYSNLNGDIPVKAYECCPCEFNISNSMSWGNDYSSGTENNEETSKLVIEVKNVKTYFKNGLLTDNLSKMYNNSGSIQNVNDKIDSIMIYDLVETIERNPNYANGNIYDTNGATTSEGYSNLTVNGAKALFLNKNILLENEEANPALKSYVWGLSSSGAVPDNTDLKQFVSNARNSKKSSYIEDNESYRGGWKSGLNSSLGNNIKNVLSGTRHLMLLSGATNINLIENCLIDNYSIPLYLFTPIMSYNNGLGENKVTDPNLNSRQMEQQSFTELEKPRELNDQQFTELTGRELTEQDFKDLEEPREINDQQFAELTSRQIPEQEFTELQPERQLNSWESPDLSSRQIPNQEFNELKPEREIAEQKYVNIKEPRNLPDQDYKEIENPRIPDAKLIDLLLIARNLPGFKDMTLEDIRKLPEIDLLNLANATDRSLPKFKADKKVILEEIEKIDGSNMKLLELDKGNKTIEDEALKLLKQNQALSNFKLLDTNTESQDEKTKRLKNITLFTKDFTENSDKIKKSYVNSILEMKSNLKNITKDIINKLPIQDTYIIKNGEKDNNINSALASQNDIDQINHNMKYLAIKDSDVEKLSFQTLIQLHEELNDTIQRSNAVNGLTSIVKNSVATNPSAKIRENAKYSVIKDSEKRKTTVIY